MRKFHFASICNVLRCELRLFWYSTGVLNRHLANKLPTCCQQSADCWQNILVKGGKRQSANSWPTVGQLSADCWPTVGQLLANCWPTVGRLLTNSRPTVFWGSCSSLFPDLLARVEEHPLKGHQLNFNTIIHIYSCMFSLPQMRWGGGGKK